jgi:polyhydroxybutyrate depolymerase
VTVIALTIGLTLWTSACSSGDGEAGATTTTHAAASTTAADDCTPARPAPGGDAPSTFTDGGQERSYLLSTPAAYDGTTAYPLILQFHGFVSSDTQIESETALGERGAARGYVVVTPDSLGSPKQWNMFADPQQPDDYGFIHALVEHLTQSLCVDPERVYAAGHSNGAAFVAFLACSEPYQFAVVAMVSATTPSVCPADVTPAAVAVAGTADPQVPYAGGSVGGSATNIPAATDTIAKYAQRNGCGAQPATDRPAPSVERWVYPGCAKGAAVVFYTVVGGSHPWPNTESFRATDAILDFFDTTGTNAGTGQ